MSAEIVFWAAPYTDPDQVQAFEEYARISNGLGHEALVLSESEAALTEAQVLVVPGEAPLEAIRSSGASRVVVHVWDRFAMVRGRSWEEWRQAPRGSVFAASEALARSAELAVGGPVGVLRPVVEVPALDRDKEPLIAMGSQSDPAAAWMRAMFPAIASRYSKVPWIGMDNLTREEGHALLDRASIYLPPGNHCTVSADVLAAMARGCLVVGAKCFGLTDIATLYNGLWSDPDEHAETLQNLELACTLTRSGHHSVRDMTERSRATLERYSAHDAAVVLRGAFGG